MRTEEHGWEPDDYVEHTIQSARCEVDGADAGTLDADKRADTFARWADDRLHGALCAERDGRVEDVDTHLRIALVEALLAVDARLEAVDGSISVVANVLEEKP
jgi:hypothetical protein